MSQQQLSRRERKKQQNKNNIINAALELFQTQGFEQTSIHDISEAADVSRSTFFNYFPTKESLLSEIAAVEIQHLQQVIDTELTDIPSAVTKIGQVMHLFVADTAMFLRVTRQVLLASMAHPTQVASPSVQIEAILQDLIRKAQNQGEIRADLPPEAIAHIITGIYLSALFSWIETGQEQISIPQTDIETAMRMILEGIAGPNYNPT